MDRLFHLTSPDPERPCRVETRCRQSCLGFAFSSPWRCCHRAGVAARALEPARQPLLALESTPEKGVQGRPWTSTLTERVKLLAYFKNGNEVPRGSSQAHARRWACPQSRSPRINGVPILDMKDLQDQRTFTALKRRR